MMKKKVSVAYFYPWWNETASQAINRKIEGLGIDVDDIISIESCKSMIHMYYKVYEVKVEAEKDDE